MDFLFILNRKIADRFFVPILMRTHLRPNHITILSLFSGLVAAGFVSQGSRPDLLMGAFFLQLSFILDNCDGTVARLKSMGSRFGMWFDLLADLGVDLALWTALAVGALSYQKADPIWIWSALVVALAGSFIHFLRIVQKRLKGSTGKETPGTSNSFLSAAHTLGHDGDPSLLVWILAGVGNPAIFLFLGAFYVHFLWTFDVIRTKIMDVRKSSGFTLIELVMVMAIVGILAAFAMPKFQNMAPTAKIAATQAALGSIRAALTTYYETSTTVPGNSWQKFPQGNLPAGMFPDGRLPLNSLTGKRGVQGLAVGGMVPGKGTSPSYGFYYVQYNNSQDTNGQDAAEAFQDASYGRAAAYSDAVIDTSTW